MRRFAAQQCDDIGGRHFRNDYTNDIAFLVQHGVDPVLREGVEIELHIGIEKALGGWKPDFPERPLIQQSSSP